MNDVTTTSGWAAIPHWVIRDSDLTKHELLAFIVLLDHANAEGEAWPSLATLESETRCAKRQLLPALRGLEEKGLIVRIRRATERSGSITTKYRVNVWRPGDSATATPENEDAEIIEETPSPVGPYAPPPGAHSPTPRGYTPHEERTREERTSEVIPPVVPHDDRFDEAWAAWPRKVGKKPARQRWERLVKAGTDPELLLAAVEAHAAAYDGTPTEYVPHLTTWLNQERFEEEPPAPRHAEQRTNLHAYAEEYMRLYGGATMPTPELEPGTGEAENLNIRDDA